MTEAEKRFKKINREDLDWKSFYRGWIEGGGNLKQKPVLRFDKVNDIIGID